MNKKLFFLSLFFTLHLLPMDYMSGLFSSTVAMAKQCIGSSTFKTMVVAGASAIIANTCFTKVSSWFTQKKQKPGGDKKEVSYITREEASQFVTRDEVKQFTTVEDLQRINDRLNNCLTMRKAAVSFLTLGSFRDVLEDFVTTSQLNDTLSSIQQDKTEQISIIEDLGTKYQELNSSFEQLVKGFEANSTVHKALNQNGQQRSEQIALLQKQLNTFEELLAKYTLKTEHDELYNGMRELQADGGKKFKTVIMPRIKSLEEKHAETQERLTTLETILLGLGEVVQHPDFEELYKKASPRNGDKAKFNLPIPVGLVENGNGSDSYPGSPSSTHDSYQGSSDDESVSPYGSPTVRKRILSNSH